MIVCLIRPRLCTLFYPGFITTGTFSCDALGKAHLKTSRTWSSVDLASASSALGLDIQPRKTVPVVPVFVPASPRRDQRSERKGKFARGATYLLSEVGCPRENERGVLDHGNLRNRLDRMFTASTVTHTPKSVSVALTTPLPSICVANYRLEMSTTTPFRELPGRAKAVLPGWELKKDKEEVTYTLNKCRGVPQNCVHDVSACCLCYCGGILAMILT